MTEATAKNEITVIQLYNDFLYDIDVKLDTARTLLTILGDNYFMFDEKKIQEDKISQLNYLSNYKEIQTMLFSIREFLFQASKTMETVTNIKIKDVVPTAQEKESA